LPNIVDSSEDEEEDDEEEGEEWITEEELEYLLNRDRTALSEAMSRFVPPPRPVPAPAAPPVFALAPPLLNRFAWLPEPNDEVTQLLYSQIMIAGPTDSVSHLVDSYLHLIDR
jgi:hypothetical protein